MAALFTLSPRALADVDGIRDYISRDSVDQARRVVRNLFSAMEQLAKMPEMGHWREDLAPKLYRFWPVHSYLIVYLPDRKPLWVVRVFGGAQLTGFEEVLRMLEE